MLSVDNANTAVSSEDNQNQFKAFWEPKPNRVLDLPRSPTKTPAKDAENSLKSIKSLLSPRGVDVVSSKVINLNSKNVMITNEEWCKSCSCACQKRC